MVIDAAVKSVRLRRFFLQLLFFSLEAPEAEGLPEVLTNILPI